MNHRAADAPPGAEIPPFERRITREMARIHGAPLRNLHTELDEARRLGFPDLVVAGPLFVCFFSEMFTRAFGEDWIRTGRLELRFRAPVFANQTVAARARVAAHEPEDGDVRLRLQVWCERREDGARTGVGSASVRLPPGPI